MRSAVITIIIIAHLYVYLHHGLITLQSSYKELDLTLTRQYLIHT